MTIPPGCQPGTGKHVKFSVSNNGHELVVTDRGTIVHTALTMVRQIAVIHPTSASAIYLSNLVYLIRRLFFDITTRDKYPGRSIRIPANPLLAVKPISFGSIDLFDITHDDLLCKEL
jgi:hypothetical protein